MSQRRSGIVAVSLFVAFAFAAQAEIAEDAVVGTWLTAPSDGGQSHIEIVQTGESFSGSIVWLELPNYPDDDEEGMGGLPRVDRKNPDSERHGDPILGLKILDGLTYEGEGEWKNGTIYDPNNGKTYKSQMRLEGDDVLMVRGFIGFSFIGRSTEWTRVVGEPSEDIGHEDQR